MSAAGTGTARMRWPMLSKSISTLAGSFFFPLGSSSLALSAAAALSVSSDAGLSALSSLSSGLSAWSPGASRPWGRRPCPPCPPSPRRSPGRAARAGPCEDNDVGVARDAPAVARHVQALSGRAGVGARGEVELLAVLVEDGERRVAHPVGQLRRLRRRRRVDEDRVEVVLEELRVGQPPAVGRPAHVERLAAESVRVDLDGRGVLQLDVPEASPLVVVGDLLGVGRPGGPVEERRRVPQVDDADLPTPVWSLMWSAYSPDSSEK